MEYQDDCVPQDEQAIRDRIDDEIVNHDLMERVMPDGESGSRRRELPQRWGRT
jgi:hypothetical protein